MTDLFRNKSRRVFLEISGPPPWPCAGCGEPVEKIGLHKNEGHVHHIDFDSTNYASENLEIRHPGCHTRVHGAWSKGKKFSLEHRAAISESLKGNQNRLGTNHSVETRRKISASMAGNRNRSSN